MERERASRAVHEAARRAMEKHRSFGVPIAVECGGQIVQVEPEHIEVPLPAGPAGLLSVFIQESAEPSRVRDWLEQNCPILASYLSMHVPAGIVAYLSPRTERDPDGLEGLAKQYLLAAGQAVQTLELTGANTGDFKRRWRSVGTEDELVQLLCETSVGAAVARVADLGTLVLNPETRAGKHCDLVARLDGHLIWGEVKRYADGWPFNGSRPRALSAQGFEVGRVERARAERLRGKLISLPDQFLSGGVNVLFLFEDAWTPLPHVRAALWGDRFYGRETDVPDPDGLFGQESWKTVSACCWVTAVGATARTQRLWLNPRAATPLPPEVVARLEDL